MRASSAIIALSFALTACHADEDERKSVLQSAERTNISIANGQVVRDLRAPGDSGRIIYTTPTHLSQQSAPQAGAEQVWAPFGIATPDTVPASGARSQQSQN